MSQILENNDLNDIKKANNSACQLIKTELIPVELYHNSTQIKDFTNQTNNNIISDSLEKNSDHCLNIYTYTRDQNSDMKNSCDQNSPIKIIEESENQSEMQEIMQKCLANKNSQREKYIEEKILRKYSKNVKPEVYKEEYFKVYNQIRAEISEKIMASLIARKEKEIEIKKKKLEYYSKKKLEDFQNAYYKNLKEEYELQKIDILNEKCKEFDENAKEEFLGNKDKIKRELYNKYDNMVNQLIVDLEEAKANLLNQKENEKKRLQQLSRIQGNIMEIENNEKEKNKQINTMIKNYTNFKMDNRRLDVYPNVKNKNKNKLVTKKNKSCSNLNKKINVHKINQLDIDRNNNNNNKDNNYIGEFNYSRRKTGMEKKENINFSKNNNQTAINIRELNNKIKNKTFLINNNNSNISEIHKNFSSKNMVIDSFN